MTHLHALLAQMTLDEKIGQLVQLSGEFFLDEPQLTVGPKTRLGITQEVVSHVGSVLNVSGAAKTREIQRQHLENSRLKIPLLFMADVIYGYRTIFPIPLALGCTWEPSLIRQCCVVAAKEAASAGSHVTFAPMADLVRDARWGRCMESTGEDVFLNTQYVRASVEGFQQNLATHQGLAACVKHFVGYGAPVGGRDYNTVELSHQSLFDDYFPPFQAAIEAGCEMVMTSFNTVDGIPVTANPWLLKTLLRERWHFQGITIADYAAVKELIPHGVAADEQEACALAFNAGLDIDMKTACYANGLKPLLAAGKISEQALDAAVLRVLRLKQKLGLFEDPYRGTSAEGEQRCCYHPDHLRLARETAGKSVVVLKNERQTLPFHPETTRIALIGPYADNPDIFGLWAVYGEKSRCTTLKAALQEVVPAGNLRVTQGCDLLLDYDFLGEFGATHQIEQTRPLSDTEREQERQRALDYAREADIVLLAMGEHMMQSGEAASRTDLHLPRHQVAFIQQIAAVAKKTVLILFNGRPLVLTDVVGCVDAIVEAWFPGLEGSRALVDIISGARNPSGRLSMSFPYANGQVPVYYNALNTGRPAQRSDHSPRFLSKYLDCPNTPLFPFGFGLSWHHTTLSTLSVTPRLVPGGRITVSVTASNSSHTAGCETIQLYLNDCVASIARPALQLKAFTRISLAAGASQVVSFEITENDLGFYDAEGARRLEYGRFRVFVGLNSADLLEGEFYYAES
ncbi:TPA: beta-glucosidase BglX [Kluyvera ascorbata]|nr:beta-glucosidase BglX [Kluyvera ascorbata]